MCMKVLHTLVRPMVPARPKRAVQKGRRRTAQYTASMIPGKATRNSLVRGRASSRYSRSLRKIISVSEMVTPVSWPVRAR